MSSHSSSLPIARHPSRTAWPAGLVAFAAIGLVLGGRAIVTPSVRVGTAPAPLPTSALCLPHDAALGNAGGDPYAFYVFNRDEELARTRSAGCGSTAAPNDGHAGRHGAAREAVAQVDRPEGAPRAP